MATARGAARAGATRATKEPVSIPIEDDVDAAAPKPPRQAPRRKSASGRSRSTGDGTDINAAATSVTLLVQRAASILEEELATGIDAVQRIETRFVDVEAQRARDDDDVIFRFRRDAHEIVDILMDLIDLATGSVGGLARAIRITGAEDNGRARTPRVRNGAGRVAVLEVGEPIARGESGTVQMSIENDDDEAIEAFSVVSSGLVNESGDHIGPEQIEFEPAQFDLPAAGAQRVTVTVAVPGSATPGAYSGVVQTTKFEGVRAVLVVTVV